MTSHIGFMIVFAFCTATVFGTLLRETPREQLRLGTRIFGGLVAGAFVIGWLLYGLLG